MLYSCTHVAPLGVKGLKIISKANGMYKKDYLFVYDEFYGSDSSD